MTAQLAHASPRDKRIRVCVRVRPFTKNEAVKAGGKAAWTWHGNTIYQQIFPAHASGNAHLPSSYAFDHLYGPTSNTSQLYDEAVRDSIAAAVEGYHAAVFVYGQTGTGKTHTMQGTRTEPGLIQLAVEELFALVARHTDSEFLLRFTYLETYNERVFDLLAGGVRKDIKIYEVPRGGVGGDNANDVVVHGLEERAVASVEQVLALVVAGNAHRHIATTEANDNSSRSHTIFRLVVERQRKQRSDNDSDDHASGSGASVATLNLVDLAGSESVRLANTSGVHLEEGRHINRSLLTLGHIIWKLSRVTSATDATLLHLPYRNSKLTRILQPALGGRAQIAIVCTVAPSVECLAETHSTLKFASRARRVKSRLAVNQATGESALLRKYRTRLRELQAEWDMLEQRRQQATGAAADAVTTRQLELRFAIDNINRVILNSSTHRQALPVPSGSNNSSAGGGSINDESEGASGPGGDGGGSSIAVEDEEEEEDDDDENLTTDDEFDTTKRDLTEPESESVTGRLTELSDASSAATTASSTSTSLPAALRNRYHSELASLEDADPKRALLLEFVRALDLAEAANAALQRENERLRDELAKALK